MTKIHHPGQSVIRVAIERRSSRPTAAERRIRYMPSQNLEGVSGGVCGSPATPSKYRSQRCMMGGDLFDSKAEARRFAHLALLQKAGRISELRRQPAFRFEIDGKLMFTYRADAEYLDHDTGLRVVEDVKGVRTPVYNLKKRIIEASHNIKIVEIKAK